MRRSVTGGIFASLLVSLAMLAGCDSATDSSDIEGDISISLIDAYTNFHTMALEWNATFEDTLTLRYLLAVSTTDTLSMSEISASSIYSLSRSSIGSILVFSGLEPETTYYVWMAMYRASSSDPLNNLQYEMAKVSFTTCASPYTSISREPIRQTGMRGVAVNERIYILWPAGTFERYDPNAGTWTDLPANPNPRADFALSALDGVIYAIGGTGSDAVDVFDPIVGNWASKAAVPSGIEVYSSVVIEDTIFTFASMDRLDASRDWSAHPTGKTMMAYVPSTDSWFARADRPGGDVMGPIAVFQDSIYMFASYNDGNTDFNFIDTDLLDEVYVYSPERDTWSSFDDVSGTTYGALPDIRAGFHVATVYDRMYLIGGTMDVVDTEDDTIWTNPSTLGFSGSTLPWTLHTVPGAPLDFGVAGDVVTVGSTIFFINGGDRWPAVLGAYTPALDDCGVDVLPWDRDAPYGIEYVTEVLARAAKKDPLSGIRLEQPRR